MKNKILAVLKNDTRLWQDEEFNQTLLIDLVEKYDKEVISILFEDEKLKQQFFVQVNNAWVFKVRDFVFFIEENKVNNSYTDYKNQIGLTDGKHFLKDTQDVVLDFPFKDCILEGGQSTDEGMDEFYQFDEKISVKDAKLGHKPNQYNLKQAKRKEVFFNQVLAKDEIDRLLDPKALTNGKKYTKDGINDEVKFNRDENGLIKDNLIIKGNNLLALHSLKSNFAGKVKLIYIDPPYNTGNDSFKYNDNFNHSTWLTFMKNRLEVARELLSDDGVIFVQCNDNEQAYLKVLMDEVFGRDSFVNSVLPIMNPRGNQANKYVATSHETIHIFSKNNPILFGLPLSTKQTQTYDKKDDGGTYREIGLRKRGADSKKEDAPNQFFSIYYSEKQNKIYLNKCKNAIEIIPKLSDGSLGRWRWSKKTVIEKQNFLIVRKVNRNNSKEYDIFEKDYLIKEKRIKPKSIWDFNGENNELATRHTKELNTHFENSKSEGLIQTVIELSTQPNDLVLDYHLGSGTTCAVAHKMGRQYIGIEQMDYIEDIAVKRMQKVITGEQGGISKNIDWQSGGEFVYFELAKWNEQAKDKINACENLEALISLFDDLYDQYFLNYNLKITEFKEKVILEKNFKNLGLDKQKQMFLTMLDLNQMFINKSEMADSKYQLSKENQILTKDFYGNK